MQSKSYDLIVAVFHALVGSSGCVLGIDHCPRLVSVAHTALARSPTTLSALRDRPGVLNAQTADGRKGAPEGMTPEGGWNVIHVGAAVGTWEQVEVLERQLARGGLMFVPVGEAGRQAVWLIKKGDHGECERERLFGVRYIPWVVLL
jgi:protein-L-isoaspartate(D-aspartate) O-methyltransferase